MRKRDLLLVSAVLAVVAATVAYEEQQVRARQGEAAQNEKSFQVRAPAVQGARRPRMVDVGAATCKPCRYMAPILEEARSDLAGIADVEFVDLRFDRDAADRYGVRILPTQIFYDRDGREVWRHEGVLERREIVERLLHLSRAPAVGAARDDGSASPGP